MSRSAYTIAEKTAQQKWQFLLSWIEIFNKL